MSICDEIKDWDDTSPMQRYQDARDTLQGLARSMGFGDDVKIVRSPPPAPGQDRRAAYDRDTNTMYLHPDLFADDREGGWKYAYDSAAEELAHHMQNEMDEAMHPDVEEDEEDEDGDAPPSEDEVEDSLEHQDEEREDEARDFATEFMALAEEMCDDDPEGAESALQNLLDEFLQDRWDDNVREDLEEEEGSSPKRPPGEWRLPEEEEMADA